MYAASKYRSLVFMPFAGALLMAFLAASATSSAAQPSPGGAAPLGASGTETHVPAAVRVAAVPANRGLIRICTSGNRPAIDFAATELEYYLRRMSGASVIHVRRPAFELEADSLWLGCFDEADEFQYPQIDDASRDDAILVHVKDRQGVILGANPRAALIAAYEYLGQLGCRWVRPGDLGEYIPRMDDPLKVSVDLVHVPAYRHRGICIEGATSAEHLIDLVDWLPKVGMNTYFVEYLNGYLYYNNWYSQRHRPESQGQLLPNARAEEFVARAAEEIKRRGMFFHRAGHGWTCLPLGIPEELWDEPVERDFGPLTRYMALYEGKRQLYRGIPRRTHLCYSNAEVRRLMADAMVGYAKEHPEVDYLHFWLADGGNHFCECDECRKARPSDWYVTMLNEVDERLTAERLSVRIVFLAYMDLLWPPVAERLKNADRFVLMFAPLNRSYYEPFDPTGLREAVPPFALNRLEFPPSQNLNFLAAWQRVFAGDSFLYDYRFMWGQYDDPGHMRLAAATGDDVPRLHEIGLRGMISDQPQRSFMPTGWAMTVMARKLWQSDIALDGLADDYFRAAFGADGPACREYLERISSDFQPEWLSQYSAARPLPVPTGLEQALNDVGEATGQFRAVIRRNLSAADPCQAASWAYLAHHADVCELSAELIQAHMAGDRAGVESVWPRLRKLAIEHEDGSHPVFDVFLFLLSLKQKYRLP